MVCSVSFAQKVAVDPIISPALFKYDDQITVTYDVTGTTLANLSSAYIWIWIPGENIDAKYNINPATSAAEPARFTKTVNGSTTIFSITFRPSDFFSSDISGEVEIGMLIKGPDWSNGQSTDFVTDLWDGSFQIKLTSPTQQPLFVNTNDVISIEAQTPVEADFDLFVNNVLTAEQDGVLEFSGTHTVTETSGSGEIHIVATSGSNSSEVSFQYIIPSASPEVPRPQGIISGINYHPDDDTKVTLCLLAPGKSSVYVRGDFSEWNIQPENLMNKDGEFFWIELSDLNPGTEYGFQYLVDQTLFLADPYADKILDPDDQHIPSAVYPDLKPFPDDALSENWYFNRVSVFQTGQEQYEWQVTDFQKPDKKDMVIYELLVRDFFDAAHRSYKSLGDTITYFKRLGVNVIELMPVMEFNGNDSWGYNPTFMFAPDKYYGTKNMFKEFIDRCHAEGIAVILDIAMNHQDMPNPYVMMDFNFDTNAPNPTNPWFNVSATHPFNVFFDMNHESAYTKKYLDTVNHYWLNEYNVDGFRFDLSKGFTQQNNPDNVGAWSAKDDSRIALLKRMADKIREHTPEAILILEHLAVNSEEKILAEYGFLMWGNMNHSFSQVSMGYVSGSDLSGAAHTSRGWTEPNLVSYMESHDEERMMYRNLNFGNSAQAYSVKNLETALDRIKAAATMFFAIPGPKMIWQFGELGYDVSIDENDRTGMKPLKWEYYTEQNRRGLFDHFAEMANLKKSLKIFETDDITFHGNGTLEKQLTLRNSPYTEAPTNQDEMNVQVVVNFDVLPKTVLVNFPHTGRWHNYFVDEVIQVTELPHSMELPAGAYRLFMDYSSETVTSTEGSFQFQSQSHLFPNPVYNVLTLDAGHERVISLSVNGTRGEVVDVSKIGTNEWDVSILPAGMYIAVIRTEKGIIKKKFIKH